MPRFLLITLLGLLFLRPTHALAFGDDGKPPIQITSPDQASTFVHASVTQHSLYWNKKTGQLVAHLVFTDLNGNGDPTDNDAHDFRIPGVTFDQTKGLFFATSSKGKVIPVARIKKTFFFKSIETLPNAAVRIQRMHGNIWIVLEAVRPDDPSMRVSPSGTNSDSGHAVDIKSILQ